MAFKRVVTCVSMAVGGALWAASSALADDMAHTMSGAYGSYPMSREVSGTSWEPDSTPVPGIQEMHGEWMTMLQGNANLIYDNQGGPRGDQQAFSTSMFMGMASRPLGDGTLGLRTMFSLDPLMGPNGYPLLLQTGETADGVHPLVDRQHPHDLFMELAVTYSHPVGEDSSVFTYVGYPGEPALGPTVFMSRMSGMADPEAPITHHWLDATHISYGVTTLGYVWRNWKIEASAFNGREPDQYRWNFDAPQLDSNSVRLTYNPTDNWSMQVSTGYIHSPEALEPDVDQRRTTASATYNLPLGQNNWQTTAAWGRDDLQPGRSLDAYLLESSFTYEQAHTVFGRAERVAKDELFSGSDPLAGQAFTVNKFSLGYVYDLPVAEHVKIGLGGVGSLYALPSALDTAYGRNPASFMLFARASLY